LPGHRSTYPALLDPGLNKAGLGGAHIIRHTLPTAVAYRHLGELVDVIDAARLRVSSSTDDDAVVVERGEASQNACEVIAFGGGGDERCVSSGVRWAGIEASSATCALLSGERPAVSMNTMSSPRPLDITLIFVRRDDVERYPDNLGVGAKLLRRGNAVIIQADQRDPLALVEQNCAASLAIVVVLPSQLAPPVL
jgi:hypothetical protein